MTIKDLVEGEIYSSISGTHLYVFMCGESSTNKYSHRVIDGGTNGYATDNDYSGNIKENLRSPTQNERNWLLSCIEKGKYMPKEEALKHYNTYSIY